MLPVRAGPPQTSTMLSQEMIKKRAWEAYKRSLLGELRDTSTLSSTPQLLRHCHPPPRFRSHLLVSFVHRTGDLRQGMSARRGLVGNLIGQRHESAR